MPDRGRRAIPRQCGRPPRSAKICSSPASGSRDGRPRLRLQHDRFIAAGVLVHDLLGGTGCGDAVPGDSPLDGAIHCRLWVARSYSSDSSRYYTLPVAPNSSKSCSGVMLPTRAVLTCSPVSPRAGLVQLPRAGRRRPRGSAVLSEAARGKQHGANLTWVQRPDDRQDRFPQGIASADTIGPTPPTWGQPGEQGAGGPGGHRRGRARQSRLRHRSGARHPGLRSSWSTGAGAAFRRCSEAPSTPGWPATDRARPG
jgi:hypothetical protein